MKTQSEKYQDVMTFLKRRGYEHSVTIDVLKSAIMDCMAIKESYMFKFHTQNMETLGLIRSTMPGLFEIVVPNS